jgi:hypothetical protein
MVTFVTKLTWATFMMEIKENYQILTKIYINRKSELCYKRGG